MKASIDLILISVRSRERFVRGKRFSAIKVCTFFLLASSIILASKFILFCFSGILYIIRRLKYFELLTSGGSTFYTVTYSDPYFQLKCEWGQSFCIVNLRILLRYLAISLLFYSFTLTRNCVAIYAKHDQRLETATSSSGIHDIVLACHQFYLLLICIRV